jgi:hypothetical protein
MNDPIIDQLKKVIGYELKGFEFLDKDLKEVIKNVNSECLDCW